MTIRIGRTLPPAAVPISLKDILNGVAGLIQGGNTVRRFVEEIKTHFGIRHSFLLSSGKASLVLILQALHDLSPERDEVLIPAYTCYSVPSAIERSGLKVRLCDLASGTLDFDFEMLKKEAGNPRLLCVIPTHLFGVPADVERVKHIMKESGAFVVEDAAQSMGSEWNNRMLGTSGDAGLFSMGRGKSFSTVSGGIIVTDNDMIGTAIEKRYSAIPGYRALDYLKLLIYALALSLLVHPWIFWLPRSIPFLKLGKTCFNPDFPIRRLSTFQAGMATGWIDKIKALKETRGAIAKKITDNGITSQFFLTSAKPDLIRFPLLAADVETKIEILRKSEKLGVGIVDVYPDTIDGIDQLSTLPEGALFPEAKHIAERILTLPVHPFVNESDIQVMASLLKPLEPLMSKNENNAVADADK